MDKKELQPVVPGELAVPAQTTVNQYGDKSVHIDTVTHMSQNVTVLPIMQRTSTGGMKASTQAVSNEYYHLFVMGGETFEQDHFLCTADRAMTSYWTAEDVRNKYGRLTAENIEELKTFPALFMQEADGYYAKPSDEQQAYLGVVEDIRVQDNGIKIRWRMIWPIPMQQISRIGFELGMLNMTKAISELNHTHWAIKRINLFEELKDAGISLFGFV